MHTTGSDWAIVLAGGSGNRLRSLTTDPAGNPVPKQYCSLLGGPSLLAQALQRARRLLPPSRILVVVAAEHAAWWRGELAELPAQNILVQPRNRGTAAGLLLPLAEILRRDPDARVLSLPSDHHVRDEALLQRALGRALAALRVDGSAALLLGVAPEGPDPEYGYIVPGVGSGSMPRVAAFVEKPGVAEARELLARGALWNSFLLAARAATLWQLCASHAPELTAAFEGLRGRGAAADLDLAQLYATLAEVDFSRGVLQRAAAALRVLRVPACGWTDLGTPERLAECVRELALAGQSPAEPLPLRPAPSLAQALRRATQVCG